MGGATDKATVLFFAANPSSTTRLALDEEARAIEQKITASRYRDALDLRTRWAVQPDDLLQALNQDRPTIVHFSGHGTGATGIVLGGPDGKPALIDTVALRLLFRALRDRVRVVVLNACWTEPQARALAEDIDCVIGMTREMGDDAARVFAASLYRAIGFGRSVQNAFDQGVAAIALAGSAEETTPQLFVRTGIRADDVVIVHPPGTDRRRWFALGAAVLVAAGGVGIWALQHGGSGDHEVTQVVVSDARLAAPAPDAAPPVEIITADHGIAAGGNVTILGTVDIGASPPDAGKR